MPLKLLGCIAGLLLLAGCSKVKENLKPVELQPIEPSSAFKKLWGTSVGKGQDARYARLQPLLLDGVLYTVDVKGKLTAVNAATGKKQWQVNVKSEIGGGVGYSENQLLLGTLKGDVIALALEDGTEQWRSSISSEVLSAPSGNGDVVVAKAIDGRVFALNASDGKVRWSYDHPVPVLTLRAQAGPVVDGSNTYVAFDNGQLLAFASGTGQLRWSARVGQPKGKTEIERLVDVDTTPIVSGPFVYSAGYQSRLVAVNRGTGRLNWAQDASTFHSIIEAQGKIIVSDAQSHIKAFDASTGTLVWESDKLHRREASPPGVLDDAVVLVDFEGYIHALDINTGEFVARSKANSAAVYAPILSANDVIIAKDERVNVFYVLASDGVLSAYTFKDVVNRKNSKSKKGANVSAGHRVRVGHYKSPRRPKNVSSKQ